MHFLFLLVLVAVLFVPRFAAAEEARALNLQPKLLAAVPPSAAAPFATPSDEGRPLDLGVNAPHREAARSACGIDSSWCYDNSAEGGRIVYRRARNFMPHIGGLNAENISLKRERNVFRYSFR